MLLYHEKASEYQKYKTVIANLPIIHLTAIGIYNKSIKLLGFESLTRGISVLPTVFHAVIIILEY